MKPLPKDDYVVNEAVFEAVYALPLGAQFGRALDLFKALGEARSFKVAEIINNALQNDRVRVALDWLEAFRQKLAAAKP